MREIKFRAWNTSVKQMLTFSNPVAIADGEDRYGMFLKVVEGKIFIGGTYVVMQYTGLNDKNGKEIYEGDILQDEPDEFFEGASRLFIVEWLERECGVGFHRNKTGIWENSTDLMSEYDGRLFLEVIGNIHESPELLT